MTFDQIKTASDLKGFVENAGSLFFTRNNMKFAGDTMANYGVRRTSDVIDRLGTAHAVVIELYRRRPVKYGLTASAFFVADGTDAARRIYPHGDTDVQK